MRRFVVLVVSAVAVLSAAGAPAGAVGSTFSGGQLTITSDGGTVVVGCTGDSVTVNGADPPGGAVSCAAVTLLVVQRGSTADNIDLSGVDAAQFTALQHRRVRVNSGGGNGVSRGAPARRTCAA